MPAGAHHKQIIGTEIRLMAEPGSRQTQRVGRAAVIVALLFWFVAALALPLAALQLNLIKFGGFPLGFWVTAQGASILLALVSLIYARGMTGRAFAFAGEALPAAGTLGCIAAVAAQGHDGLALPLGFAAGLALLVIVSAPRIAASGAPSLPGFFASRFDSTLMGALAGLIVMIAAVLIIAGELRGAAIAIGVATDMPAAYGAGIAGVLAGVAIAASNGSSKVVTGLAFVIIALALIACATAIEWQTSGGFFVHGGYGRTLEKLDGSELSLLERALADAQFSSPMTTAFLDVNMISFAGIVLGIAFGTSTLPYLLKRHAARQTPRGAARTAAGALTMLTIVIALAPAIAVMSRLRLNEFVSSQVSVSNVMPSWLLLPGVKICGADATDAAARTAACAALPGHEGTLRLHDIAIPAEVYPFLAFEDAGLPFPALPVFAAAIILAVLLSVRAAALGSAPVDAGQHTKPYALALLTMATGLAATTEANVATLFASGLVFLGASLFPAFALTLLWPRLPVAGASFAMLTGAIVAAGYLAGPQLFPREFFALTGALSSAPVWMIEEIASLEQNLVTLARDAERAAALAQIDAYRAQIANWWGVKPLGAALFAVPAALLTGLLAGGIARLAGPSRRTAQ